MRRISFILAACLFLCWPGNRQVRAFKPLTLFNSSDITNLEYQKVLQSLEREGEWDSEGIKELALAYHGVNNKFRAQKAVYRMKKIIQANRAKTKSNFVHLMTDIQLKLLNDYRRELKTGAFHNSTFHDLTRVLNFVNQKIVNHVKAKECLTCPKTPAADLIHTQTEQP
ncbi:hypothetical protein TCAL_12042 [Tigriopus californicus]|uniref:Uncharacterized protein n=1 Tax=Tigriopus californicus TaxID=6832 RepID=A0A553PJK8_TIGCA|nr:uncharacterized protein LOC131889947 [Tigriopus californicus]TRY77877.1 hypothetical protein TCAL_12042 [Tigriopus californicus]|eukprot:TCALIF_12042-PA protein Name:"Protein of unknown function" AED:0.00 eAED:0.00 QI:76/1/1/1/0.5/0.66/3/243/168